MKFTKILLFLSLIGIVCACNDDVGEIEVTYTKATAKYGNLDEIRNTPLLASPKDVVNPGKNLRLR